MSSGALFKEASMTGKSLQFKKSNFSDTTSEPKPEPTQLENMETTTPSPAQPTTAPHQPPGSLPGK